MACKDSCCCCCCCQRDNERPCPGGWQVWRIRRDAETTHYSQTHQSVTCMTKSNNTSACAPRVRHLKQTHINDDNVTWCLTAEAKSLRVNHVAGLHIWSHAEDNVTLHQTVQEKGERRVLKIKHKTRKCNSYRNVSCELDEFFDLLKRLKWTLGKIRVTNIIFQFNLIKFIDITPI